ncbi:N-acyl-D-glutamate deacylase [Salinisphaera sp. PC39]|uniref:N-acyl-D-amino-acid deacylase family protein n=1 Tax=Salinisphaera sp. PC39 TaxID=1304156 RepID=UPI0033407417
MTTQPDRWDVLFAGALVFDGTGGTPRVEDVAVKDGRIAARGPDLPQAAADRVVDASGQWLMPGLLDIHTHFDLEVELAPGLPEAIRHGTTTALVANCSLGMAFGNQRRDGQDPLVACFARVENIPKHVLEKVAGEVTWRDSGAYLAHFDDLSLGPNIAPMIPHSMLRIEVMGLDESVRRKPTRAEIERMAQLVEKGMDEGYLGFSTDDLPFHYLANDPHRRTRIPTQFGSYRELRRLTSILRARDRVWQATPNKDSRGSVIRKFFLTSGRLFGKPLKLTAVAALDVATNRSIARMGLLLSRLLNSRLVGGRFRLQALSAPFTVWADGPITPLAEEIPELRELNEPDLEDREARRRILDDPDFVARFRKMWFHGKSGFNLANLKRLLNMEDLVLNRRLDDMFLDAGGAPEWAGESMQAIHDRLRRWQAGDVSAARSEAEEKAFAAMPDPVGDDCDFFLYLLRTFDTDLRWHATVANRDPGMLKKLLFHPLILPGFNDSGAHLTNMAFYDGNLRTLKLAAEDSLDQVATQVRRLTREPAAFLGLNAGSLEVGAQADILVIDPEALAAWNPAETVRHVWRDEFDHHQMVNRVPGVVRHVMVGGAFAWRDGDFTAEFGRRRFGRALRHRDHPAESAHATAAVDGARAAA